MFWLIISRSRVCVMMWAFLFGADLLWRVWASRIVLPEIMSVMAHGLIAVGDGALCLSEKALAFAL